MGIVADSLHCVIWQYLALLDSLVEALADGISVRKVGYSDVCNDSRTPLCMRVLYVERSREQRM